jgi:hypothetical protein
MSAPLGLSAGREIRENMFEQVADLLHDLDDGMRPISVFFPYLPTDFHRRRDAARIQLGKIFAKACLMPLTGRARALQRHAPRAAREGGERGRACRPA